METQKSEEELWDEIWKAKKPIPCFKYRESLPANFGSGIIEIVFYDFLNGDKDHKNKWCRLFDEKHYQYTYPLVAKGNSWLYMKAPSRFDINVAFTPSHIEQNEEIDPEISSYTIKSNEGEETFKITVIVPQTLRLWYASLVGLGIIFILCFLGIFASAIYKGLDSHSFSPVYAQVGISIPKSR